MLTTVVVEPVVFLELESVVAWAGWTRQQERAQWEQQERVRMRREGQQSVLVPAQVWWISVLVVWLTV